MTEEEFNGKIAAHEIITAVGRHPEVVAELTRVLSEFTGFAAAFERAEKKGIRPFCRPMANLRRIYLVEIFENKQNGVTRSVFATGRLDAAWGHCLRYLDMFGRQEGCMRLASKEESMAAFAKIRELVATAGNGPIKNAPDSPPAPTISINHKGASSLPPDYVEKEMERRKLREAQAARKAV